MGTQAMNAVGRTAFAIWDEHIAPVFDVSRRLHVVTAEDGRIVRESRHEIPASDDPVVRSRTLVEMDVEFLVCGAVSRPLLTQISAHGIEVVPFITGELRPVVDAWMAGTLNESRFSMPGCCGRGRGRRLGPSGECLCPRCGRHTVHVPGEPCHWQACPDCGAAMIRTP